MFEALKSNRPKCFRDFSRGYMGSRNKVNLTCQDLLYVKCLKMALKHHGSSRKETSRTTKKHILSQISNVVCISACVSDFFRFSQVF